MRVKGMMLSCFLGAAAGIAVSQRESKRQQMRLHDYGNKYYDYFQLMYRWMVCRNEGKQVGKYLEENGIKTVAIYGMGDLANCLAEELKRSNIEVVYGIDREVCCTNSQIADVYSMEDKWPEVDIIIITPFRAASQIGQELAKKCSCRWISLEEVIYSL